MARRLRLLSLIVAFQVLAGVSSIWAQAVGKIVGTVSDPSGAVIQSAKIMALQRGTGLSRIAESTSAGTYSLPQLPVGSYDIFVNASGFEKATASAIPLDVSQVKELNFKLALANATTKVEVYATPPLLQTENGTLEGLVNSQQVSTLPLNGRNILNLIMLQPGINMETNSTFVYNEPIFAGNGNRGPATAVSLDGVDASDAEFGGVQFSNLNPDAIEQFKVLQNSYSAEYGQGAGTVVQLVSKSGTDQLHGSLFEFLRNSALDARNYFSVQGTHPPFQRNEFGGTVGGPVFIPRVYDGRDRTFFFFEYAGFRQRLGEPTSILVPTAEERTGLVPVVGPNGQADHLVVPLSSQAQQVLKLYPQPNNPNGTYGANTYTANFKVPENHAQFSVRVDRQLSASDSLFGRFTEITNRNLASDPAAAVENPLYSTYLKNDPSNFGTSETHTFSPALINTLTFGVNRMVVRQAAGITNVPQTQFSDGSLNQFGPDTSNIGYTTTSFTFHDGVNWTKGRHSMAIGAEYRRTLDDGFGASNSSLPGFYTFAPGVPINMTIPYESGQNPPLLVGTPSPSGLVSFMLAQPSFYGRSAALPGFGNADGSAKPWHMRRFYLNFWMQDDIQVTHKLTVNLGLRYEYNSVPYELDNRFAAIIDDPTFAGPKVYRHTVLNPSPLYRPDYRGWGPRIGFAEKVTGRTVVRGGFAIFTNMPPNNFADQASFNFPFAAFRSTPNPEYFPLTTPPLGNQPALTDLNGNALPPSGGTKAIPRNTAVSLLPTAQFFNSTILTNLTSVNLRNGYTISGNFTVQQQLPGDILFQAAYVANDAVKLYSPSIPNGYTGAEAQYAPYSAVDAGLGEFILLDNHAHSTYNALQTTLRKVSPSHGLQFQASYTFSKVLDNASTVFDGTSVPNSAELLNNPLCTKCERGVSGFDFPHRFVVNLQYQLPLAQWNLVRWMPKRMLEGWQSMAIAEAQSGFPFTVTSPYGTRQFGTDTFFSYQPTRPDLLKKVTLAPGNRPQLFSAAVVADAANLTQVYFGTPGGLANGIQDHPGTLSRNTFRTRPFSNTDFSLVKDTKLTESALIQFRAEFFNIFNQHSFAIPSAVLGSSSFGSSSATVLAERQIQFGLRVVF